MTAPPRPGFSRRWTVFFGATVAAVVVVALFVRVNRTPSVREGVYLVLPEWMAWGEPAVGDLVTACAPEGDATRLALERQYLRPSRSCPSGAVPLLKRVVATGGQTVEVAPDGVRVDGARINGPHAGPPPTADRQGRPLTPAYGTWRLERDALWLGSDIPNGYDSRYLGPFGAGLLRARARLAVPFD